MITVDSKVEQSKEVQTKEPFEHKEYTVKKFLNPWNVFCPDFVIIEDGHPVFYQGSFGLDRLEEDQPWCWW